MSFFFLEEEPPNPTNKCKFFNFHTGCGRSSLSSSNREEEDSGSGMDDEQEVVSYTNDVVVSEILSRAMEAKSRRKASFSWIFSPTRGDLFVTPKEMQNKDNDHEENEDFFSVGNCFSRSSSARSAETFVSVRTNFSRSSSLSSLDRQLGSGGLDWRNLWRRRTIIQELGHCEGWPFGLCRRALLLPPLPMSPSESWSWRKNARLQVIKLP